MRFAAITAAALLVAGCHYQPTPIPMTGDRSNIKELAGTWTGTYRGTESGRTGSINFTIKVTADSAFGEVMMDTPVGVPVLQPADDPARHRLHASSPGLLAIRFVDIYGGSVEGALEPYIAPDCDCTVTTTFTGSVRGDTIRGTFLTRGRMMSAQTGVWAVVRER